MWQRALFSFRIFKGFSGTVNTSANPALPTKSLPIPPVFFFKYLLWIPFQNLPILFEHLWILFQILPNSFLNTFYEFFLNSFRILSEYFLRILLKFLPNSFLNTFQFLFWIPSVNSFWISSKFFSEYLMWFLFEFLPNSFLNTICEFF